MTWILTYTGQRVDLLNPTPETLHIEDIAHALANLCRFNGHTRQFYSVAQHALLASHLVTKEHAYSALMHDAAEAYLGDVTAPLKSLLSDYKGIEKNFERALFAAFGVTFPLPQEVKKADMVLLATERRDLMPKDDAVWECLVGITPLKKTLLIWTVRLLPRWYIRRKFIARYNELKAGAA